VVEEYHKPRQLAGKYRSVSKNLVRIDLGLRKVARSSCLHSCAAATKDLIPQKVSMKHVSRTTNESATAPGVRASGR